MVKSYRGDNLAILYKIDILKELRERGYTSTRLRQEKLIGEGTLTRIRRGETINFDTLSTICELLECNVGDIIEYVKE